MDSAKLNYFLIFKSFFMKKLVFAMGCFAAILLTSSCTPDSPIETKTENLTTPTKTTVPGTEVFADEKDDPIPPRG
jgi:hypothetical protein